MLVNRVLEYSSPSIRRGWFLRFFFILSTCILVCFSEHWYSYAPGCSVFYTTVDASGSHCGSFSVLDGLERLYWWQKGTVMTEFHFPPMPLIEMNAYDNCYPAAYVVYTALTSSTHSSPHSSLQGRRAWAARDCQTPELVPWEQTLIHEIRIEIQNFSSSKG